MAEIQNGDFLEEVMRALIPRLKEFTNTQFTSVMCAFTAWSMADVGDKKRHAARFAEVSKSLFTAAASGPSSVALRCAQRFQRSIPMCVDQMVGTVSCGIDAGACGRGEARRNTKKHSQHEGKKLRGFFPVSPQ